MAMCEKKQQSDFALALNQGPCAWLAHVKSTTLPNPDKAKYKNYWLFLIGVSLREKSLLIVSSHNNRQNN